MSFLDSLFKSKKNYTVNSYHQYAESSTEPQKKIDNIISFRNVKSFQELSAYNVELSIRQVYEIMLGSSDSKDAFIYSFNKEIMISFLNNNKQNIKNVLDNLCKEIYTELKKNGYAKFSSGFAVSPIDSIEYYEKLKILGNFLKNRGFANIIIEDTKYASNICEYINTLIQEIENSIELAYANNRNISSSTTGILEEIQLYISSSLREIIASIYQEAQKIDVAYIIDGMVGGENSLQKSKILEKLAEVIKSFDISELPLEAQDIYNEIRSFISEIEPHREDLQSEAILLYTKLTEERLPEILQQYMVLPKTFLKMYKDLEDSPQQLLIKSLNSMKLALKEIHVSYFNKRMLDLKVTQLYMKELAPEA